ncbi:MAG: GAF domain-containing protein [Chloroflexi bacterium]|nr:GAF domain-containing protein [Chloroflexota bacterium]
MNDQDQAAEQLAELRQRVAELEATETDRKLAEEKVNRRAENLRAVSELAVKLAAAPPENDFFRFIAETLKSITGALATSISAYDAETQKLVVRHIAVDGPILTRLDKLLGYSIVGMRIPIDVGQLETILTEVVTTEENLSGISFGAIPKSVAAIINRAFNLGSFAALSLQHGSELMGTAAIVMPKGEPTLSKDLLMVFAHVAAASLHRRKAEKALKESEERYRSIVELAPDGIITVDLRGTITSCNTAFLTLSGYSIDEIVGRHFTKLPTVQLKDIPKYVNIFRSIIKERLPKPFQFLWKHKDGGTRWGEIRVSLIKQNSSITGIQAVIGDITERKQAEERLAKINEGFLSFGADPLENINRLTARCGEMLGATCALYNRLEQGLLCSWGQWNAPPGYNPTDKPKGHICYDVIQQNKDEVRVIRNLAETPYAQTDPNVIPYGLQTYAGCPVKFEDDYVGSLCVVYQDDLILSEADKGFLRIIASAIGVEEKRKQAEDRLQERKETLRALLNAPTESAMLVDLEGTILAANQITAQRLGKSLDELIGLGIHDYLPHNLAESRKAYTGEILRSGKPARFQDERAGRRFDNNVYPVPNAEGKITTLAIYARDITEQVWAERLLRIQRDLGVALGETSEITEAMDRLLEITLQLEEIDSGGVYLVDQETGTVKLAAHKELNPQFVEIISHYDADTPQARLVMAGESIYRSYSDVLITEEKARRRESVRAVAVIPVKYEDADGHSMVVASLNLGSHTHGHISANTRNVLEGIAAQVGGVIARVRAEEALRQRTAQLEALRQVELELTAQLDLDILLNFIASQAVELLGGSAGGLYLYRQDRDVLEWAVDVGSYPIPLGSILHRGEGLSGQVWETDKALIVDDYTHWEGRAAIYDNLGLAAIIAMPIRWGDEFLGVLDVLAEPPRTFSPSDAELLALFATQVAIAIRNARLLQAERDQREMTEALVEASATINSVLVPEIVLDHILEQVQRIVAADFSSIMLLDADGTARMARWRGQEQMGFTTEQMANIAIPIDTYKELTKMIQTGEPIITMDTASYAETGTMPEEWRKTRSHISAPIRAAGQTVGFLNVSSTQPGQFNATDAQRLQAFANQAAIGIENSRLHRELAGYAKQLEERVQERTVELETQYARLDAILDSTTDGIAVADGTGDIVRANPIVQAWLTQTLSPKDAHHLRKAIRNLAIQTAAQITSDQTAKEERPEQVLELTGIDLKLNAAPLIGEGMEKAPAVVVAIHDVSPLKALDRMKTHFITNISHELRTPITTVKLYAHLMKQQPQKWQDHLNILAKEADHLAQLVEGILKISRVDAGRLELDPRPVSLNELVQAAVAKHLVLAQEQGTVLEHRPTEPEPTVLVDPDHMAQVLNNLVENAIYYTPEKGTVVVSSGIENLEGRTWATMTVADTGMGIPQEDIPLIFDRFFRGEKPRTMQITGTGLGLAIVQKVVALHGGQVTVESEEDVGSTFTIWLPLAE